MRKTAVVLTHEWKRKPKATVTVVLTMAERDAVCGAMLSAFAEAKNVGMGWSGNATRGYYKLSRARVVRRKRVE